MEGWRGRRRGIGERKGGRMEQERDMERKEEGKEG